MWHSDTISLAPSRCWLHTHAAASLHVHTYECTRIHTSRVFPPLQQMFRGRAYASQIQRMRACLHLMYPKMFFSCAAAGAAWGHMTCLSFSNTLCRASKHKIRNTLINSNSIFFFLSISAGASITTISKPSLRGPSWETLSSKPCELDAFS